MRFDISLKDVNNREIDNGDIVEWDDSEGTRTAKVIITPYGITFHCFKNAFKGKDYVVSIDFPLQSFIYRNTSQYLRIIRKWNEGGHSSQA